MSGNLQHAVDATPLVSTVDRWRFVAAVVAIPLFDALLAYIAFPVVWWLGDHGPFRPVSFQQAAVAFGTLAAGLGFLVMITAALPITDRLIRRRQTSVHHFALAGVVLGNLPFVLYLWIVLGFTILHLLMGALGEHLSPPGALLAGGVRAVLIGSVMGGASGVVFWLIARPQSAGSLARPIAQS